MKDIVSALKGMSQAELGEAVNRAKAFMATPEGQRTLEKLKKGQSVEGLPVTAAEQNQIIAQLSKDPLAAKKLGEMLGKK